MLIQKKTKKYIRFIFIILLMCILSTPAFAGTRAWTGYLVPTKIRQARDSSFQIYVPTTNMINQGCTYQDFYIVNHNNYVGVEGAQRMFSMILTSIASGKEVNLYIDGTCDSEFSRPAVLHIEIKN